MKYYRFETTLTTTVTAFRWPTKSMLVFQPSRSMIWAVGPELFMAWAETRYWPSGDQLSLRTCVVPPHWIKAREKRGKKRENTGSRACKQLKETSPNPTVSALKSYFTEGFGDVCLQLPVHGPPDLQAMIICLGSDVLSNRVPRQAFHQACVSL